LPWSYFFLVSLAGVKVVLGWKLILQVMAFNGCFEILPLVKVKHLKDISFSKN